MWKQMRIPEKHKLSNAALVTFPFWCMLKIRWLENNNCVKSSTARLVIAQNKSVMINDKKLNTLNLHKKIGDGNIAALCTGELALFISTY